ncbi:phospholipase A [Lacinutrix himadriensis]|uniref:phospholipase A n=1 Tax=Lacinutrix himadriensis TaxID=641549 RepID=UPI0006E3D008|nr:phospholipase A [Lacinutrix himadriensis]
MKIRAYIFVFLLWSVHFAFSQNDIDTLPQLDLSKIALINQSDSYITFPTDIGNIASLMFEANVNPSFVIRKQKNPKLMAVLTAQIIIRMYNEESYPVRTPSYIPQIAVYYLVHKTDVQNQMVLFGKIAHHSNGQVGDFYNEDNTINLQSGNFATNFVEFGFLKTGYSNKLKAIKTLKSAIEIHPKSWLLPELKGRYSGLRWHNSFTSFKFPLTDSNSDRANFSLKAEATIMLDNYNDLDVFDLERFNASVTFYYHPKFLEDIGLFVQFYHGMDYYNIYFEQQLSVIRFGIMTEILRF